MNCIQAEKMIHLYIERKLSEENLEDFLEHVEHCKSCSEELEVNFSIYSALKQLTTEEEESFDMKDLLKKDIADAKEFLREADNRHFMEGFERMIFLCTLTLFMLLFIESAIRGGFQNTKFYQMLHQDPIVLVMEPETETDSDKAANDSEPETNHKKEIIRKTPETEEKKAPGPIPDEI